MHMSLQMQWFLLSYLKTLSVGPAQVWTRDLQLSRPALSTKLTRRRYIRNDNRPVQPEDRLCRACVDVFLNLS